MTTTSVTITIILMSDAEDGRTDRLIRSLHTIGKKLNIQICVERHSRHTGYHHGDLYFFDCGKEEEWFGILASLPLPRRRVVLISDREDSLHALLRCGGYDLIRPSCMEEDIRAVLIRCREERSGFLILTYHSQRKEIPNDRIHSVTVCRNNIQIRTGEGVILRHISLRRFIIAHDLLRWMVQINRAVLVNPLYVQSVQNDAVYMKDGTVCYLSRLYGPAAREALNNCREAGFCHMNNNMHAENRDILTP